MSITFHNGHFVVDSKGLATVNGKWRVPLSRVAEVGPHRVSSHAVVAAAYFPRVPLGHIEAAVDHAIKRAGGRQPDWSATHIRMEMVRVTWPLLAERLRKAIAGESL